MKHTGTRLHAHVPVGIYRHLLPSTVVDNRTRDAWLSVYLENW